MKVWFNWDMFCHEDFNVRIGVDWSRHHDSHPWKGVTITVYLYNRMLSINWVDNWQKYSENMRIRKEKREKWKNKFKTENKRDK
jgi:hypothetical protein